LTLFAKRFVGTADFAIDPIGGSIFPRRLIGFSSFALKWKLPAGTLEMPFIRPYFSLLAISA